MNIIYLYECKSYMNTTPYLVFLGLLTPVYICCSTGELKTAQHRAHKIDFPLLFSLLSCKKVCSVITPSYDKLIG